MSKSWKLPTNNFISSDSINISNTTTTLTTQLNTLNNQINTQIIPVTRGGTGVTDITQIKNLLNIAPAIDFLSWSGESVSNGDSKQTKVGEIALDPGTYIMLVTAQFGASSTGNRWLWLTSTSGSDFNYKSGTEVPAFGSGNTFIRVVWITKLDTSANYYIYARQNSGSAINCTGQLRILQIFNG